jgi:hypothetical protein
MISYHSNLVCTSMDDRPSPVARTNVRTVAESEDHAHLLHCPADHRVELFIQLSVDIDTLCDTHRSNPHLYRVLIMMMAPYWGETLDFDVPPEYKDLILFQHTLHPDSLFLGCFSGNGPPCNTNI